MTIPPQSVFRFNRNSLTATAIAVAIALDWAVPGVKAQTIVGGSGKPGVSIDMNMIRELGPAPSVADVLSSRYGRAAPAQLATPAYKPKFPDIRAMGRTPDFSRVVLRPPGSKPVRATKRPRKAAPKRRTKRAAVTPKRALKSAIVAKPAAPPKLPAPKTPTVVVRKPIPAPPPTAVKKPMQAAKIPAPPVVAKMPAPAKTPMPLVAAKPKPAKQTASLPPAGDQILPGNSIRLIFPAGSVKLSANARRRLDSVAQALAKNSNYRLQLLAYASGPSKTASRARRMSLSRALAARLHLIDRGVSSTRIDVRALGNKSEEGPPDRIDLMVSAQ